MLHARAIVKLLIEEEGLPADPLNVDADLEGALSRYVTQPPTAKGVPVTTYQEFKQMLGNRKRKNVFGTATRLIDMGDFIGLQYHDTFVVSVTPENRVTVDTGGWYTVTTMDRINRAAPGGWKIYGRKPKDDPHDTWNFFWSNYSTSHGSGPDMRKLPFTDMDTVEPDGTLTMQADIDYTKVK